MGWFSSKKSDNGGAQDPELDTPLISAEVVPEVRPHAPPARSNVRIEQQRCLTATAAQPTQVAVTIHVESNGPTTLDSSSRVPAAEESSSEETCSKTLCRHLMLLYMCFVSVVYAIFVILMFGSTTGDPAVDIAIIVISIFSAGMLILFWRWYYQKRYTEVVIGTLTTILLACFLDALVNPGG
jgi:hypothetical protein